MMRFYGVLVLLVYCIDTSSLAVTSSRCLLYNRACNSTSNSTGTSACPRTETCRNLKGKISHCFALYRNHSIHGVEVLKMGCWLQDLVICSSGPRCEGILQRTESGKMESLYFCCCTGNLCNEKISGGNAHTRSSAGGTEEKERKPGYGRTNGEKNVIIGCIVLACGVVAIATTMCVCRYVIQHRSNVASKRDGTAHAYSLQLSTTGSSEASQSSDNIVPTSPERFQLIQCLLRSRLGEIWIARLPPAPDVIKIKISPGSVVHIYDNSKASVDV